MAAGNLYSTFVAWMKILLPLVALGLLSSVVFFAREADDHRTIPFVAELADGETSEERVTRPEYVGLTSDGSTITMKAETVRPVGGNMQILDVDAIVGVTHSVDGRDISSSAPTARFDTTTDKAEFFGQVDVETSDGYMVTTQGLTSRLDVTRIEGGGPVLGTAPFGTLEAGGMLYTATKAGNTHLLFNGGVKLIYQPRNNEAVE